MPSRPRANTEHLSPLFEQFRAPPSARVHGMVAPAPQPPGTLRDRPIIRMSAMQKTRLAHTDLDVSELCLGTNMFGTATPQAQAEEILNTFAALGGNFLDTAHSYGDWIPDAPRAASEHAIGAWLQKKNR